MRVLATRLLSLLRHNLIGNDLILFLICGLLTGYTTLIHAPSHQSIRPFHPPDASLWSIYTTDTFPTYLLFIFHYLILIPLIHNLTKCPRLSLGMLPATMFAVLLVELGKGYVGRLRPCFATLCFNSLPSAEWLNLSTIYGDADCPTPHKHLLRDARRSFPSGHAALAVCGAVYFQLCINRVMGRYVAGKRMALYAVGWAVMGLAAWVAASRIVDNAHHVGDVAAGSLIGVWAACAHFWYVGAGEGEKSEKVE